MRRVHFGGEVTKAPAPPPTPARLSEAAEAWDRTKDITNIGVLEAFIARFKDTFLAELARARVDELKKQQMALVAPPKAPEPATQGKPVMTVPPPRLPAGEGYKRGIEIVGSPDVQMKGNNIEECRRLCEMQPNCVAVNHYRGFGNCNLYMRQVDVKGSSAYDVWMRK
jgi:hypothetical protein